MRNSLKLNARLKTGMRLRSQARRALSSALEPRILFSTWINTQDIDAVRQAYQDDIAVTTNVPIGWTGHIDYHLDAQNKVVIDGGDPGTVSPAYQTAVLHRDNYFREMAGIPDIAFDPAFNAGAQEYALYGSAYLGADLGAHPDSPLLTDGKAASVDAFVNLSEGALGADAVTGYMMDGTSLEHRNLRLNPNQTLWGFGDVPYNNGTQPAAGDNGPFKFFAQDVQYCPNPTTDQEWVSRDPFVAWPPSGFVPIQTLGSFGGGVDNNTWNFNYQYADFSNATVTITRDDQDGGGPHHVRVDFESDISGKGKLDASRDRTSELQWRVREDNLRVGSIYHVKVANFYSTRPGGNPITTPPISVEYDVRPIDGAAFAVTQNPKQSLRPVIIQNPANQVALAGSSPTFVAEAAGNPGVQWQLSTDNGASYNDITNNPTATTTHLTLSNVDASQSSNKYQAVFTAPSPLVTFTSAANGDHLNVQWQYSTNGDPFVNVPAEWQVTNITKVGGYGFGYQTTSTLSAPVDKDQATYQFRTIFTNPSNVPLTTQAATATDGTVFTATTTPAARLRVVQVTNPADRTATVGDAATFTAAVTPATDPDNANKAPGVQWEVSNDNGANWSVIPAAWALTLKVPQVTPAMNGNLYRAVFSFGPYTPGLEDGRNGLAVTTSAKLTVTPKGGDVYINPAGRPVGNFAAESGFSGSSKVFNTYEYGFVIDDSKLDNPPPQTVLRSQRSGSDFTCTVPNLSPGAEYSVTLDFAEMYGPNASPGRRIFNVAANGAAELTHFDISQEAENLFGADNAFEKAISRTFTVNADGSGVIALHFTGDPSAFDKTAAINGIEIRGAGVAVAPPVLSSVMVNDGTSQRSQVKSLTLSFDQAVSLAGGALSLQMLNTGGSGANDGSGPTDASAVLGSPTSADGGVTWVCTFVGGNPFMQTTAGGTPTGSLVDGIYTLSVDPSKVTANGVAMTVPGSLTFHRLFGDANGNGSVNTLDYGLFRNSFGKSSADAGYNAAFDFDGNGVVNTFDYGQFRGRFGKALTYA